MQKNFALLASTLTAVALLATSSLAMAQAVPSSAESSRVGGQLAPAQAPLLSKGAPAAAPVSGSIAAPSGADKVKLTLKSVAVDNMTVYHESDIASIYQDMVGKQISLADVYAIADKLTAKYRNEGYILTQVIVPPQTIDNGNIRLRVVEGFVDQVVVQGDTHGNTALLQGFAENIRKAKPLNAKALERYVLLMNELSGLTARAVLAPSKTPGASDVTIVVEQKPYDAFFQLDNRGSRYLGPLQANTSVRLNNTFGLFEGINVQFATAPDGTPDRELDYAGITWTQPLDSEGTKLSLSGSVTSTLPGYDLTPFDVHGLAHSGTVELSHPFIRSRNMNLFTSAKFNYLNSEREDNLGLGKTVDNLRVLRLGSTFQFTDSLVGINTLTGELSKGLDIMGASDKNDTGLTRALGDPKFFKGTLEVSRLQRVTDMLELFLSASGQKSAQTLLASEEFGVGGASFGSAYDNSEITGEDGLAARTELRVNNPFDTQAQLVQFYGFYDVGKVWDKDNAVAKDRMRSLASSGLGLRMTVNDNFAGSFEYAVPLTRKVQTEADTDPRLFASVSAKF
jgi:hemolysin activation/secretion protein